MARTFIHGRRWTSEEDALLRELYPTRDVTEIASQFDRRSPKALRNRAKVIGVRKAKQRKQWNDSDYWMIRTFFPHIKTDALACRLRATVFATRQQAQKLGLRKTIIYLASSDACRLRRGDNVGAAFRFRKGQISHNKGLRRPGWYRGRMRETQFRKGQEPHNAMPMWSFRFVDGYLMLKTGAPPPKPTNGWEYVHKMIWEHWNGPLPDWRVARLWWKDGDHGNCSLSNLELVTAQEHMRRTTLHNLPAPLPQLYQLNAALKRKINRLEKNKNGKEHVTGSQGSPVRDPGITL